VDLIAEKKIRKKLEEVGVDIQILNHIDSLEHDEQQGIYHFFLEIMNDELLFILALRDNSFSEMYLREKERNQPMSLN
jgi:hypothetical protein